MRSRLTRHVLRQLLAHQGMRPYCSLVNRPVLRAQPVACRATKFQQRRTFLGLFKKPPRTLKQPEAEPGYETLLQFRVAESDNVRPPPKQELVRSWRVFFGHKARHNRPVNSTQVLCAHRVLLHLSESAGSPFTHIDQEAVRLTIEDLRLARDCVSLTPREQPEDNLDLAKELYVAIRRQALGLARTAPLNYTSLELLRTGLREDNPAYDFTRLLAALSSLGEALAAKDLLLAYYTKHVTTSQRTDVGWVAVIRGLAQEGHEKELLDTVAQSEKFGLKGDQDITGLVTTFYAQRNNVEQTKRWFQRPMTNNLAPSRMTYYEALQFALRNDQKEWALEVYQDMIKRLESGTLRGGKYIWDTSFQWAILLLGKGVDHVEHMLQVNKQVSKDKPNWQADIETINRLLRVAIDKNDAYMAERFVALCDKLGFEPNTNTYLLQMEYRMLANDLDGAFSAFANLSEDEVNSMLPLLNRFIRQLCSAPVPNYQGILEVTSFIEQRHATLDPETVVSICMAFLKNDEQYEVIDTLSLHTVHYSVNERQTVRQAFVAYCLDTHNSTARVWDAYALLRQFFPEVENEDRVRIMNLFLDRKRADMAAHVFGHMRSHNNPAHRPNTDAYVSFFEGQGRSPDLESLQMVHNMLKMDTMVTPTTKLYNSLMIAYTACDMPYNALDIWKEITTSLEGPTYESLEIAFRAYEITPEGDEPAQELWLKIRKMDIDVPLQVYSAYVTALAAHGNLDDVKTLLTEMADVTGQRPNLHTLAYVHNALQSSEHKDVLGVFAQEHYTPVWEKLLKKYPRKRNIDGLNNFKIQRPWKA